MITVEHAGETLELRNTLGEAASAYLRSAAHQPIAWQQWGPEAFELARRLDRPVLLDIGAVWCHWCHVMDHESYEDPMVARLINENFIAIKVDRDERPDVDFRYQRLVQALSQMGGGWPLTAFLTPGGDVFSGGTYFPRTDRHGRRGMLSLLPMIAEAYHENQLGTQENIVRVNRQVLVATGERLAAGELTEEWLLGALAAMEQGWEPGHGGFGMLSGPKFPSTGAVEFLLRLHTETGSDDAREMALGVLDAMAAGGIHDQIAGGFHRYSVDGQWHVPHFEKMLCDNAALLANFAHAYALTGEKRYREAAVGILDFVTEVLWNEEAGGFGGSQDADVGPEDDGDFFTWTLAEASAVLSDGELAAARLRWGIGDHGEMHHNSAKNVLRAVRSPAQITEALGIGVDEVESRLASAQAKLLAARLERPAPFVDPTIYVSWNGMMIQGLAEAARFVGDDRALDFAQRATERLTAQCWDPARGWAHALASDGTLSGGYLDDQAQMALALLMLHQVTGEARHLDLALQALRILSERYEGPSGALRDTPSGNDTATDALQVPSYPFVDQPTAAPNPTAALAFEMASVLTGDASLNGRAERIMGNFAGDDSHRYGHMIGTAALAIGALVWATPNAVIIGDPSDERAEDLRRRALAVYRPGLVVSVHAPDEGNLPRPASDDGAPLADFCAGRSCAPPTADAEEMAALIRTFGLSRN
ncbi:thioredoxin domain-containing protein [Candidatus Sumerlaeota bacterium]|nr:thioredoxin domain-containing protein [Candidatus Sumerlaeota bacterium]